MNVTEVQVLKVDILPAYHEDSSIYNAIVDQSQYEIGSFWHEVSISSVVANKILLENAALELGEEASWTPESLSSVDTAQAIYLPACEMLKKMDGIGHYTDNCVDPCAAAPPSENTEKDAQVPYQFW
jgi:hypothetical protein